MEDIVADGCDEKYVIVHNNRNRRNQTKSEDKKGRNQKEPIIDELQTFPYGTQGPNENMGKKRKFVHRKENHPSTQSAHRTLRFKI